jgi:hypothetical protein
MLGFFERYKGKWMGNVTRSRVAEGCERPTTGSSVFDAQIKAPYSMVKSETPAMGMKP